MVVLIFPLSSKGDVTFDNPPRTTGNEAESQQRNCKTVGKLSCSSLCQTSLGLLVVDGILCAVYPDAWELIPSASIVFLIAVNLQSLACSRLSDRLFVSRSFFLGDKRSV